MPERSVPTGLLSGYTRHPRKAPCAGLCPGPRTGVWGALQYRNITPPPTSPSAGEDGWCKVPGSVSAYLRPLQRPHSCTRLPRQSARLATPPRPPAPSPWASSAARHPPRLQRESAMARPHSGMVCCDGRWYAPVRRRCLEAMGPSVAPLAPLLAGVGVSIRLWQMPPPGLHIIYAPALRTCGVQSRQMVPSPRGDVPPSR